MALIHIATLQVEVFVFEGISWEDAPEEQYAVKGLEQKVWNSCEGLSPVV